MDKAQSTKKTQANRKISCKSIKKRFLDINYNLAMRKISQKIEK